MPENTIPSWKKCPNCQGYITEKMLFFRHEDICEYLCWVGRDRIDLGWASLGGSRVPSEELQSFLEDLEIPHRIWNIRGPGGRLREIFAPQRIRNIIDLYKQNQGYAGMDLREFIERMWHDESGTAE